MLDGQWHAVEVTCDLPSRRIDFAPFAQYSLDPATYPQHVKSTSDLVRYLVAFHRATGIAFIKNANLVFNHYPFQKLMCYQIDHGDIDWNRIRINAADFEEWDYEYPEVDHEVAMKRRSPDPPLDSSPSVTPSDAPPSI